MKQKEKNTQAILFEELAKLYPNNILVNGLEDLRKHNVLYLKIRKIAKKENMSTSDFLTANGFTIYKKSQLKINYDISALKKVKENFLCNITEFSSLLGTSKQNLKQKFNRKSESPFYWQGHRLNDIELSLILKMIENEKYSIKDTNSNTTIKLYKHNKNSKLFALFIFNHTINEIKCFFDDIPIVIYEKLVSRGYDKLDEKDFEIKKELLASGMASVNIYGEIEIRLQTNSELYGKLHNRISTGFNHISNKDYIELLGFKYINGRVLTDDELRNLLSQYVIEGNYVYIPSSDPQHARMANLAHRRGFKTINEFVEYFGFNYNRIRGAMSRSRV